MVEDTVRTTWPATESPHDLFGKRRDIDARRAAANSLLVVSAQKHIGLDAG
jgi:hypothetical protein